MNEQMETEVNEQAATGVFGNLVTFLGEGRVEVPYIRTPLQGVQRHTLADDE